MNKAMGSAAAGSAPGVVTSGVVAADAVKLPLGLFGGRFDPVHRAHIAIAQAVADQLGLHEVRWIVTGDPEHKPVIASPDDRLRMTRIALQTLNDPRMVVDDREIRAAERGESNFTADTVAGVLKEFPNRRLIWILGEDQLQHFLSWSRWDWLIHQVELAVCARPGAEGSRVANTIRSAGGVIHWVKIQPDSISSTEIRNAVQAGDLSEGLVPPKVADYIADEQLYH
jgi:nicotinate-nucleotide adenylyltransferase